MLPTSVCVSRGSHPSVLRVTRRGDRKDIYDPFSITNRHELLRGRIDSYDMHMVHVHVLKTLQMTTEIASDIKRGAL